VRAQQKAVECPKGADDQALDVCSEWSDFCAKPRKFIARAATPVALMMNSKNSMSMGPASTLRR